MIYVELYVHCSCQCVSCFSEESRFTTWLHPVDGQAVQTGNFKNIGIYAVLLVEENVLLLCQ